MKTWKQYFDPKEPEDCLKMQFERAWQSRVRAYGICMLMLKNPDGGSPSADELDDCERSDAEVDRIQRAMDRYCRQMLERLKRRH